MSPFVQEFEFKPVGKYRKRLEELEVIFQLHPHGMEVLLELDKRVRRLVRLFADFDLNERYAQLRFRTRIWRAATVWQCWIV